MMATDSATVLVPAAEALATATVPAAQASVVESASASELASVTVLATAWVSA